MTAVPSVIHSAKTDDWLTPPEVFEPLHAEFDFDIDLTASAGHERLPLYFTPEVDALTRSWSALPWTGWCNPPYSNDGAFVKKAYEESLLGFTTVLLVYAKTDVKWWHKYVLPFADEVRYIEGRVRFLLPDGTQGAPAPKGSAIIVFKPGTPRRLHTSVSFKR